MSPRGEPRTYSVSQLMTLLVRALGDRARVRVQAPFAAPDESEPEPDVAVVAPGDYLDGHPRVAFLIVGPPGQRATASVDHRIVEHVLNRHDMDVCGPYR
jgi:hypothetical protein